MRCEYTVHSMQYYSRYQIQIQFTRFTWWRISQCVDVQDEYNMTLTNHSKPLYQGFTLNQEMTKGILEFSLKFYHQQCHRTILEKRPCLLGQPNTFLTFPQSNSLIVWHTGVNVWFLTFLELAWSGPRQHSPKTCSILQRSQIASAIMNQP